MNKSSNTNRNTEIRSNKISDTSRKGGHRHNSDTVDPNRLRELKNITRPSMRETDKDSQRFSPNTVGYIDPEEFEKAYRKEIDDVPHTRGKPLKNPRTGETISTGRTSTRNGKGTGTLNDSKLGKWLVAAVTAIIIIGLIWFYVQNDEARTGLKNSMTGNTTNSAAGEVTHNIGDNDYAPKGPNNDSEDFEGANNLNGNGAGLMGDQTETVGSSRSGYYDEYGNFVTNNAIHDGDGRAFDADTLTANIASALSDSEDAGHSDVTDVIEGKYSFIIGEYDGKLAVFLDGKSDPLQVYDTYVSDLPEADRGYIKKGIRTTSVADLSAYLEDLTS